MGEETYRAEQVDQLLRCPICLDKYREPKILPCQHTFCKSPCLEGLVDMRTRIIRCAECRMEHFAPIDGAAGFPTNITLINFLDLQAQPAAQLAIAAAPSTSSGSSTVVGSTNQCGVCEKQGETTKCAHCDKFVCAACKKSHMAQMKFDIGRVVNQVRRGVPKLSNSIASVEQKSQQVRQHVEGIKAEVRNTIERYVKELKDRQTLLNSELDTFQQGELRNLRIHQENLEVELASISSYCDSTESTLNQSGDDISDVDMVNLKRQCAEYMDQINQSEGDDVPGAKQVRFTFEGQTLQNCISNFGELMVSMPGTLSGGARRNSDSSVHERETRLSRRRWSEAQQLDSVFVTSAEIDSLNIDSPRGLNPPRNRTPQPSPPVPALRNRLNATGNPTQNQTSVYTAEARPSDFAVSNPSRTRNSWNRVSYPNSFHTPWRPPDRASRTRDAVNAGYMFHMNDPIDYIMREDLARIREIDRRAGSRAQMELTRQLDQSMARQNRMRNTSSNVASIFGQEPRDYPRTNSRAPRGNGRNAGPRQGNARRGRSLDDRPAGVSGGAPPPPSTPPRIIEPLPSDSDLIQATVEIPRTPPNRNTSNQGNARGSQNNRATAQPVQTPRIAAARRVEPGISFEVPLVTPTPDGASSENSSSGSDTNRSGESQASSSSSSSPQAGTSSQSNNAPQPPPMRRQGTFTRDHENANGNSNSGESSSISRPVVNDESVSFNVPLDTDGVQDDEESVLTFRLSTSDSLTTMRPLNNYQIKGTPNRVIGSRGNETGKFGLPRGVAVSPLNDSIVVADSSNHRVQIFDVNGAFVSSFGSYGQAPGELDCVSGIAVNTMGQIIVADRYNNRIQVFDRYGEFQHSFGSEGDGEGQLKQPWGLACDMSGYVYVCDKGNNRIQVFNQEGTYVRQFGRNQLSSPNYVTVSEDNRVLVSDTNNNRIKIFNAQGRPVSAFGSTGAGSNNFKGPKGIAVDRQGFITVVDAGNSRIKVFRGDGRFFCAFGKPGSRRGHFKGAEAVGLTSNGKLVVTDRDNHRIQVF